MEINMKLYFAPNSRAVRIAWLLEELGLEYELEKYTVGDRALRTPEYYKIHPMGRIPVLEDGETRIYESGAIVQYLLARHGNGKFVPEADDPSFAEYLQWLHYAEGSIMGQVNILVVETILLPPEKRNDVNVNRALKLLRVALGNVDKRLQDREYLTGSFSGADIMTGHACFGAMKAGAEIDDYGQLKAYIDRLLERPALKKARSL
jgi:glutathione S-transferase|tara:strand:- start:125 stop:742 length:618 start_codon:yes stop_codon:yes gene_type:complete